VRLVPAITALWTGGLLLITLLHLEAFDLATTQTRIWFGAYVAYPLIGIWILVRRRGVGPDLGPAAATWTRRLLIAQGILLSAVGCALLAAPRPMAAAWPWPVTALLAQIYSAPLLAYGIGSLLLARARTWREIRIPVTGIGLFALLALLGSVLHRALFDVGDPVAWVWFGALAAVAGLAIVLMTQARSAR
jgi:hypothetical protein